MYFGLFIIPQRAVPVRLLYNYIRRTKISIGIDMGISTTRIVGIREGEVTKPLRIKATGPVAPSYGAFGKYLHDSRTSLFDIERVMFTGVGAHYIDKPIYGLPTAKIDEFLADGSGAQSESKLQHITVVSMGTGASLAFCDGNEVRHISDAGIGGSMLNGLSRLSLQTGNINEIITLVNKGDTSRINLQIKNTSTSPLPDLPMDATAFLFANVQTSASREGIALGLIGLILQSIGSAVILSSLNNDIRDSVLIGSLNSLPQYELLFPIMEKICGVCFIISKSSEYCAAIGAVLQVDNIETI